MDVEVSSTLVSRQTLPSVILAKADRLYFERIRVGTTLPQPAILSTRFQLPFSFVCSQPVTTVHCELR